MIVYLTEDKVDFDTMYHKLTDLTLLVFNLCAPQQLLSMEARFLYGVPALPTFQG